MTVVAFSFGVLLFLASLAKPKNLSKFQRRLLSTLSWLGFIGTLIVILKTAALMLVFTRPELWLACKRGLATWSMCPLNFCRVLRR
jgi:hypothetical protein